MKHNHYTQYVIINTEYNKDCITGRLAAEIYENLLSFLAESLKKDSRKSPIDKIFDKETMDWLSHPQVTILEIQSKAKLQDLADRLSSDGIRFSIVYRDFQKREPVAITFKPYNKGRVAQYFKNLRRFGGKNRTRT